MKLGKRTIATGLVAGGAIAVTAALFANAQSVDVGVHAAVIDELGQLDELSAELSTESLATRYGLVPSYDPLVATLSSLDGGIAGLKRALVAADAKSADVSDAVASLEAKLSAKHATVERLKRETAVLKNSLRYLPLAAETLIKDTDEAGGATGAADAINAVVQATLVYDLLGEERALAVQHERVAALVALREKFPAAVREDFDLLVRHAQRATSHHALVKPLVTSLLERDLDAQVAHVRGAYSAEFAAMSDAASGWRYALYVWCAVLLVAVAVFVSKLRALFASLEQKVVERTAALDARNQQMSLVLDNVEQGLFTIDRQGTIATERSAIVDRWLPEVARHATWREALAATAPARAEWLDLAWESALDDIMPIEIAVDQMADTLIVDGRHLAISYKPIVDAGQDTWQRMLVVVSDVTAAVQRAEAERRHSEELGIFQRLSSDRAGFMEFHAEAGDIVARLASGDVGDHGIEKRLLHTLKGNAGIFGVTSVASLVNTLELRLSEERRGLSEDERRSIAEAWHGLSAAIAPLIGGDGGSPRMEVSAFDLARILDMLRSDVARSVIERTVEGWRLEPTRRRLHRFGDQAVRLAHRMGKEPLQIEIEDNDLRLDAGQWSRLWQSLVHAIRNAVDHGIEEPSERIAAGKPAWATVRFATKLVDEALVIEIADDGRGVDWAGVARKAATLGLPCNNHNDLVAAMLAPGVTTRDVATDISGQGVGMSAVRDEVAHLGGHIDVESVRGAGTVVRLVFAGATARFALGSNELQPTSRLPRTSRTPRLTVIA